MHAVSREARHPDNHEWQVPNGQGQVAIYDESVVDETSSKGLRHVSAGFSKIDSLQHPIIKNKDTLLPKLKWN